MAVLLGLAILAPAVAPAARADEGGQVTATVLFRRDCTFHVQVGDVEEPSRSPDLTPEQCALLQDVLEHTDRYALFGAFLAVGLVLGLPGHLTSGKVGSHVTYTVQDGAGPGAELPGLSRDDTPTALAAGLTKDVTERPSGGTDRTVTVTLAARSGEAFACPPTGAPVRGVVTYAGDLDEDQAFLLPPEDAEAAWRDLACSDAYTALARLASRSLDRASALPTAPDAPTLPAAPSVPGASADVAPPQGPRPEEADATTAATRARLVSSPPAIASSRPTAAALPLRLGLDAAAEGAVAAEVAVAVGLSPPPPPAASAEAEALPEPTVLRASPPPPTALDRLPTAARATPGLVPVRALPPAAPPADAGAWTPRAAWSGPPAASGVAFSAAVAAAVALLALAAVPLFHRVLHGSGRLQEGLRGSLLAELQARGPLRECDLGRALGVERTTVRYHLRLLLKAGAVASDRRAARAWFYLPGDPRVQAVPEKTLLRRDVARALADAVARGPGRGIGELAGDVGTSPQNAHYHLARLARAGFLSVEPSARGSTYFPARAP